MSNYILGPNGDLISADELYHYGIKGMKWGVRRYQNKDGSLTPAGKKRLVNHMKRTFDDNYSKSDIVRKWYNKDGVTEIPDKDYSSALSKTRKDLSEDIRQLYDNPNLKRARDKYFATMKISEDFYSDDALVREFRNKGYMAEVNYYAKKGEWIDIDHGERVDKRMLKNMHMNGERDKGEFGAFNTYLRSKGLDPYRDYSRHVIDARREYLKECKKFTNDMLGIYGNRTVADYTLDKSPFGPGRRVKKSGREMVEWILDDLMNDEESRRRLES